MDHVNKNISLRELADLEDLTVRSLNICAWNGLNDLLAILNYFWRNDNFLRLRNCGQKSNKELIELCLKYEGFSSKPDEINHNTIEKQIDSLTVRQKKILNNLIVSQSANISERSLNAIRRISNFNITILGLKKILIESKPKSKLLAINNIGKKTVDELTCFFNEIKEQINIVQHFENDDELKFALFKTYLNRKFKLKPIDYDIILRGYNHENGLPIFKTIKILISNGTLLKNEKEIEIFYRAFNFWNNSEPETLEKIGSTLDITRERTRQIRNNLLKRFDLTFSFLKGLEVEALNLYSVDNNLDIINIDDDFVEEVNRKEEVRFNYIFITKILSIILYKTHALIGNLESCVFKSGKHKDLPYSWNSIYLIKKEATKYIDIEAVVLDVKRRLLDRIDEDYSLHFEAYLTNFQKEGISVAPVDIMQIAEQILFNEFDIIVDTTDQITFKRTTKKPINKYVYDILSQKNTPLDVYQIYDILSVKHPDIAKSAESLRASCQRDSNLIYFGRSSTYGLRSWEDDETIKGGTMHDIAEEFLIQFEIPMHIEAITNYVSQYRTSVTSRNLFYNLKTADGKRFIFFENSYIGLTGKQYDERFIKNHSSNNRRTWDKSFELLSNFINKYNRLPYSKGEEDEKKLYRFMNLQLRKAKKGKLDDIHKKKINDLISKYPNQRIKRKSPKVNKSSFEELIAFIQENKRLPQANEYNERYLYNFFYRQSKLFEAGKLNLEHKYYYNRIINQIQEIYGNRNDKE